MLSPCEMDLVRRETCLPGFANLLDAKAFALALRGCFPGSEVRELVRTYFKYRPGVLCRAGFRVETAEAETFVHAEAHRTGAFRNLRKASKDAAALGLFGPGRVVLDEAALVIAVFPNDRSLPALAHLADPQARSSLLRELLPDRADLHLTRLQPLRYRPEKRYVGKLVGPQESHAVVKLYSSKGYQAAQTNTSVFRSGGWLRVPRVLACSSDHRLLVLQWLNGGMLREILLDPQSNVDLDAVAGVGAALAELHEQPTQGLQHLARASEIANVHALAGRIGYLCPHLAGRAEVLALRLANILEQQPLVRRAIHGDFSANQVLLDGKAAAILDLDDAAIGDPAIDLGNITAKLQRDALRGDLSLDRARRVQEAFLAGYCQAGAGRLPSRINLYTVIGLLRAAPHAFQHLEPNWPEKMEAILTRAEHILQTAAVGEGSPQEEFYALTD